MTANSKINNIKLKNERIGLKGLNTLGLEMKIIDYNSYDDITIQFTKSKYIAYHKSFGHFKTGEIRDKYYRLGMTNKNKAGQTMKIIEYKKATDITVQFEDTKFIKKSTWRYFKEGGIKDPYFKSVFGVGYLGEGKYKAYINNKPTRNYIIWSDMLERCYDKKHQEKHPSYKGCTVESSWHNFQVFSEWYYENYYEIDDLKMHLDKDIIIHGNRTYCSDACVFIPEEINRLFIYNKSKRGKYPIGVYYSKSIGKFVAQCNNQSGSQVFLGHFDNELKAFNVYKTYKEKQIKNVANKYKGKIPNKAYNSMMEWEVRIDD